MTEQVIKPCPFCGGESIVRKMVLDENFVAACVGCTVSVIKSTEEKALKVWNTRAYDAELEELRLTKQKYEYTREYLEALLRFGYTILFEPRGQIYRDVDLSSLLSKMKGVLNLKDFAPIAQTVEPASAERGGSIPPGRK